MKLKAVSLGIIIGVISTAAVITLSSFTPPQNQAAQFATLKSYEYPSVYDSKIVIIYEDGKTEEIELEKPKSVDKLAANAKKLNEAMNYLSKKGYHLVSASSEPNSATIIFEKK